LHDKVEDWECGDGSCVYVMIKLDEEGERVNTWCAASTTYFEKKDEGNYAN
jgi:hypothetical protein